MWGYGYGCTDSMVRTSVHAYAYAHMYGLYDKGTYVWGYGYGCTDNMWRTSVHAYAYAHMYGLYDRSERMCGGTGVGAWTT